MNEIIPPISYGSGPKTVILSDSWKEHLKDIAPKGGRSKSPAKRKASAANGASGGRPKKIFIYGIVNAETGRVEYIGQSENPHKRCLAHFCITGKYRNTQYPVCLVILAVTDEASANRIEEQFYKQYKALGQCEKNGNQFKHYYARSHKWLNENIK